MDRELADLNRRLSDTAMPTGSDEDKRASSARLRINAAMSVAAQAESAKFRSRSGKLDSKDLLTVLGRGRRLEDMKEGEMPAPVAAMEPAKRKAYVAEVQAKREALQARIDKLAKERDGYLRARTKGAPTAFDDTLGSALKKQGLKIGVAY
jgi:hypothetical protein